MILLKYIFLGLILLGSTSIGFLISKKYLNRVNELNCFLKNVNILQNKMKFTQKPLNEIFEELADLETNKQISNFFEIQNVKIKNKPMAEAWNEAILESKNSLNLKQDDINLVATLGNVIRKNRHRWTNE